MKWIEAVGRQNWFPSKTAVLCGRHFRSDDFILGQYPSVGLHRKVLKKDAVPSLFLGEKNKYEKENHPIFDDNVNDILHDSSSPLLSNSHSNPVFTNHNNVDVDSFNCENLSSPKTRKLKQIVKMKDKKIKRLQKKVLRQARTIKGLMATLDQKSLISIKGACRNFGKQFRAYRYGTV